MPLMSNNETSPEQQVDQSLKRNDPHSVRLVLKQYPDLFGSDREYMINALLRHSLELDSPEMIDTLVEFGADVNTPRFDSCPDGIIESTCLGGSCKKKAARRLLELGAKLNFEFEGTVRCRTLDFAISKGDLEMVKLCLEYGASINSIYLGMTALDHAQSRGQVAIAEYFLSMGAKTALELGWHPPPEPELSDTIQTYFKENFVAGSLLGTVHELVKCNPSIKVHVIDDGYQYVLQTEGMASTPIATDKGEEANRYVELELKLPIDWPIDKVELLAKEQNTWPVQWLRRLAMEPHSSGVPLGNLFFYPNGNPQQPFAADTKLSCWMLLPSTNDPLYVTSEKQIVIYSVIPIFKEEYELVQRAGIGALLDRFDASKIQSHQMFVRKNVGLD